MLRKEKNMTFKEEMLNLMKEFESDCKDISRERYEKNIQPSFKNFQYWLNDET